jgi:hypothetical protein
VLQVHALERPESLQAIPPLCDPQRARRWVEQAGRVGVPFRVALPTYRHLLAFDAAGGYLGASGEASDGAWPAGTQLRLVSADAEAAAAMVQEWTEDRPARMTGILWYRLPVDSDRFNWRWPTLRAIMSGQAPRSHLVVEVRQVEPGLIEIDLHSAGNADAPAAASVLVQWDGAGPVAQDAIGDYEGGDVAGSEWTLRPRADAPPTLLGPGEQTMIAWMRFDGNREVRAYVTPNAD